MSSITSPRPPASTSVKTAATQEVVINGETKVIRSGATVADLLDELQLGRERVAVEVDRRIVRRADWDAYDLAAGSAVEIVHFVGGG